MTVKELKKIVMDWPEIGVDGEPTEVWQETGKMLTGPVVEVAHLNVKTLEVGKTSADMLMCPARGAWQGFDEMIWDLDTIRYVLDRRGVDKSKPDGKPMRLSERVVCALNYQWIGYSMAGQWPQDPAVNDAVETVRKIRQLLDDMMNKKPGDSK